MTATSAGLMLMILMGILNISAGVCSPMIARHEHYKRVPLIGLVAALLSVVALAWWAPTMTFWGFELILLVLGLGFGPLAPLTGVSLQNTVPPYQFGTAVGGMNFLRSLTSTILVSIFGAITLKTSGDTFESSAFHFQIAFAIAALSMAIALFAMIKLEEKPLNATHIK
jgi:MFS family permease